MSGRAEADEVEALQGRIAELERRRRSAESLADLVRHLSQSLEPEEVKQRIVDSVRTLLGIQVATLYRLEPATGDLVSVAVSGDLGPSFDRDVRLPRGIGVSAIAVRERAPVVTADVLTDPRVVLTEEWRARVERSTFRAVLGVPLLAQDRVIGALAAADEPGRRFDEEEIRLTQAFAAQAALALENARLYKEVREARDFLQSITDASADAIVTTDVRGRITYFSPGAEAMFGYRAEEMQGRAVADFYPAGLVEARVVMERLRREGQVRGYESELPHRDGRRVRVDSSLSLIRDATGAPVGTLGIMKDLTARRRAEEAGRESEERFRSAFEHSAIGMALQSLDGRYLRVNRVLCEMLGYAERELLDTTWQTLTHPDDIEAEPNRRLLAGEIRAYQLEKRYVHKLGQVVWVLAGISLVRAVDGQPLYFIAQVQDITERKRAEEVRAQLEAQLIQAQKLEAVGRLAGGVAHDFNNLLTVIRGRSDLLLDRLGVDEPLRRHVELLRSTADRAAALTQQLLAFSRKQMLQPKIIDLNAVVSDMKTMLRRLIGEHIELVPRLGAPLGRVKADQGQLEQVIMNLAVNARDAMPQGGTLTLETADVELDEGFARRHPGARPGTFVRLSVNDTGVGMEAAIQAHLFEPFFTTKALGHGTGLGLATVYGIVKQSDGYIAVASAPQRGARFDIYLPRIEGVPPSPLPSAGPDGSPLGTETILLVEDEDAVRELSLEVLQIHGYAVLEARHGVEALVVSGRHPGPIHLMVTDVIMPRMSGPELARQLGLHRPEMQVLYVSGYTDHAVADLGAAAPGVAFLQKPFSPDTLARKVRAVLDRSVP